MKLTRRQVLYAAGAAVASAAARHRSQLSVEAYIFQQYASRQKKPLAGVIDEVIPFARQAGFSNIELNQEFFSSSLRGRVLELLRSNHLSMPSVYVGGAMHEPKLADATIERALEVAAICRPFGCNAVVNNPNPKPAGAAKTDDELRIEAQSLDRMGHALLEKGFQLRVHHHTPEMANNAREWRYLLNNTNPKYASLCMDVDWIHQGGQDPMTLLREAGKRVSEIHVRNSKNKLWLESVEDGDVDYRQIAAYFAQAAIYPLIVVELAYRENTVVTRSLTDDLKRSRVYAQQVFGSLLGKS
jgi:inosose dehydratase